MARTTVARIGYDSFVDDLFSIDSKGLNDKTCKVIARINAINMEAEALSANGEQR